MRNSLLFGMLFLGCLGCQPMQKEDKPTQAQQNLDAAIHEQVEEVKATLVAMWDAIEQGDLERYATYVHPDFTQFGETDPVLRIGKAAEVKGVGEWIAASTAIHTEMEEPRVTIRGDVAWIVYYWSDHGTTNGEAFASRGKSTRIFVREEEKWLCIHGHYTLLPPA